jgi:hypothetical protein
MIQFALAAYQAATQIMAGNAALKESKYNASVLNQQAGFIDTQSKLESDIYDIQKNIELTKYTRAKSKMVGTLTANTAKSGFDMGGSAVAVMLDNLTQMGIDESIVKFNYDMGKATNEFNLKQKQIGLVGQADNMVLKGRVVRNTAYSNAFGSLLKGSYADMDRAGMFNSKSTSYSGPMGSGKNISFRGI